MATFDRTMTFEKRLLNIVIEADSQVYLYGEAVEVETQQQMSTVGGNVTATLTTLQKRAVADLVAAAVAWVDAQEHPVLGPPPP